MNAAEPMEARIPVAPAPGVNGEEGRDPLTSVRRLVDERPYTAVGAALLAGYVLGGGLLSEATVRMVGLGMRVAMLSTVKERLAGSFPG